MKLGGTDVRIEVSTKFNWLQKKLWKYLLNMDIEDIEEANGEKQQKRRYRNIREINKHNEIRQKIV